MLDFTELDKEAKPESDYASIFKELIVDLKKDLEHPEILISIGQDQKGYSIPVFTAGEISCTVAPSKTKKSFLKSLFTSAYIGGQYNHYTTHIKGHRTDDCFILDIDTEQGEFYAQRTFRRVERLTGFEYKNYIPVATRRLSAYERVKLTDYILRESQYAGKIKLVLIDGIADYVEDSNNLVMSNEIAHYLLKWTDELNIHIHTVIHKTFGSDKATGHLGSAVTKKVETIININALKDNQGNITNFNTVKVTCGMARGKMFDPFHLSVNSDGLPFTHTDEDDNVFNENKFEQEKKELPKPTLSEAFDKIVYPVNDGFGDVPF